MTFGMLAAWYLTMMTASMTLLIRQVWDLFKGESLLTGRDPELQTYRSRAHLAEMIRLLGPPPSSLLAQGKSSHKFFSERGKSRALFMLFRASVSTNYHRFAGDFDAGIPVGDRIPLEQRETNLEGEDKARFLRLMQKMLQWEPSKRSSARELLEDEWICKTLLVE